MEARNKNFFIPENKKKQPIGLPAVFSFPLYADSLSILLSVSGSSESESSLISLITLLLSLSKTIEKQMEPSGRFVSFSFCTQTVLLGLLIIINRGRTHPPYKPGNQSCMKSMRAETATRGMIMRLKKRSFMIKECRKPTHNCVSFLRIGTFSSSPALNTV